MRISAQAIQNFFIFILCIWLILLVNNISNLQRNNYDHHSSIPLVSTANFRRDDNSSSSSSSRKKSKESTRQRVYENAKRNSYPFSKLNIKTNVTAHTLYDDNKKDKNPPVTITTAGNSTVKNVDMNKNENNKHIPW